MDRPFDYENPNDDRNVTQQTVHQEPNPAVDNPVVERGSRRGCRRRSRRRRRKSKCVCKPRRRLILSSNPFIIFYLEMYFKTPGKRVTTVAREAGKKWCSMSESSKRKYYKLAERVRRRCSSRRRR
ncbi:protamine-like [Bombus vosnesenskii]|uniref:Protamine-like n=2 Tax=Pyrobombus TaxID=144703 RepID=A0A6J3KJU4_9HYME|nr:protamine-like [Bombus vancouverensis nearcticus]XP_033302148.1 protamine-like [Bombus bifarius]XP_033352164.1 protamine-like [Bombus vosnesenskii]